jgi:hypothetical protein
MITIDQAKSLITSQAKQYELEQQQQKRLTPSHKHIPQEIKEVARYVFSSFVAIRPAWKVGFTNSGKTDEKQITAYKVQLLTAMHENKIDTIEKVNQGLKVIRSEKGQFLPSVGDFIQACKSKNDGALNSGMYKLYKPEQLITNGTEQERREFALKAMAEIKKQLGARNV